MKLSIIIVHYKQEGLLKRCLTSLKMNTITCDHEIIVVDNQRSREIDSMISQRFSNVLLIQPHRNLGYAAAVNHAIQMRDSNYVLILNADTEVLPRSVDSIVALTENLTTLGIGGARLLNKDRSLQWSARRHYTARVLFWRLLRRAGLKRLSDSRPITKYHLMQEWAHDAVRDVDWVLGAAMIVSRQAIAQVGYMDERFFVYMEDVDWCLRMQQKGWRVCYLPTVPIIHDHQQESGRSLLSPSFLLHLTSLLIFYSTGSRFFKLIKSDGMLITCCVSAILLVLWCVNALIFWPLLLKNRRI